MLRKRFQKFLPLYTNPFTIVPLYSAAYKLGGLVTGHSAGSGPVQLEPTLSEPGGCAGP
jgi:hypothetical protein